MTDPSCDLPGGYVDDWKAGEIAVRAIIATGPEAWFIPGDGHDQDDPTTVHLPEGSSASDVEAGRSAANEALRGSGWRAVLADDHLEIQPDPSDQNAE